MFIYIYIYGTITTSVNVIRFPKPADLQPKKYHNSGVLETNLILKVVRDYLPLARKSVLLPVIKSTNPQLVCTRLS